MLLKNKPPNIEQSKNLSDDEILNLLDEMTYADKKQDDKNKDDKCENCDAENSIIIDLAAGIFVCNNCGCIAKELYDENPEWRQYDGDDASGASGVARCGQPINPFMPQSSLGTTIVCSNKCRLKTLQMWYAVPYKERSLNIVLKEIHALCQKGKILKCIEDDAKILYKNISECKHLTGKNKGETIIIRGTNRTSLIVACIFYACLRKGETRSHKELAKLAGLEDNDVTKGCKTFTKLIKYIKIEYSSKSSTPEHFIPRFCKQLYIQDKYIDIALKIVRNIQKLNIVSVHTPLTIAVSSILLMIGHCNLNISKKEVSDKFKTSEVTITKTYKKIEEYKEVLIDDNLTNDLLKCMEEEKRN